MLASAYSFPCLFRSGAIVVHYAFLLPPLLELLFFLRFFVPSKTKFWWTSIKCIHDNGRIHFVVSVSRPCLIVVGSWIIAQLLWQSNLQSFAEMEGYYVEKTWLVFESHSTNTFCERNVCEEGGVRIKTRAISDPLKRKSKKRKIQGSWKSWPLISVALCGDWLFISLLWMQVIFAAEILVIRLAKT